MKYNKGEFPVAGKVKLQVPSHGWSTDDHESRSTIINATVPASAANGETFTVMVTFFQILNASNIR